MKKVKIAFAGGAILLGTLALSFKDDLFQVSKNLDVFASLYKEININYVEETNPSTLMKVGIDAMLENLDPYTEYVPESEIESYKLKYVSTQYGGIGAATLTINGKLFVNEVSEGYPSHKSDIRPGDEIVKINGVDLKGKERSEISQLLRGPKGTPVKVTLLREGAVIVKDLVRDEIKQPNVSYSTMLDDKVAYIKLDKFLENSAQEVKDALDALLKQKPTALILDLRSNGGGILQEAVKILNFFVDKNVLVVTQKGRNTAKSVNYTTVNAAIAPNLPIAVLINGTSASASEIVAGAIQDLDRGVVIGQRSYGKGLVQQTFSLPYNSLVKVTVAKYYTPSGRCIQALDYGHKKADGTADKFADSTMKAFNTKAGRTVYDGAGVYPDVLIDADKFSPITISLANKSLFFDYANAFKKGKPTLPSAKDFRISDADYNQFIASIANKDYSYTSRTERLLTELKSEAEKENKAVVKAELDALTQKMLAAKKNDLITHKSEIKRVLETQIISRYFFERGKFEQSFQYDKELAKAKEVLVNQNQMLAILKGEGSYKNIGQPTLKSDETKN
jgi:carboxyl-terminal processing protease